VISATPTSYKGVRTRRGSLCLPSPLLAFHPPGLGTIDLDHRSVHSTPSAKNTIMFNPLTQLKTRMSQSSSDSRSALSRLSMSSTSSSPLYVQFDSTCASPASPTSYPSSPQSPQSPRSPQSDGVAEMMDDDNMCWGKPKRRSRK